MHLITCKRNATQFDPNGLYHLQSSVPIALVSPNTSWRFLIAVWTSNGSSHAYNSGDLISHWAGQREKVSEIYIRTLSGFGVQGYGMGLTDSEMDRVDSCNVFIYLLITEYLTTFFTTHISADLCDD